MYLGHNEAAEELERAYYGKYKAFVRDTEDPEKRGRIRVYCPSVMGTRDDKTTWLDWALPCFPAFIYYMPSKGDGVWIEFEMGNTNYPIWSGTWLADGDTPSEAEDEHPANKVIKTPFGNIIELSDKEGNEHITIKHGGGEFFFTISQDGKITMDADSIDIGAALAAVARIGDDTTPHTHDLTGAIAGGMFPVTGSSQPNAAGSATIINKSGREANTKTKV